MEPDNKSTEKKKTKDKKDKSKRKVIFKRISLVLLVISLFVFAAGTGAVIAVVKSTPVIDFNIIDNLKESSKIYDSQGNFLTNYDDGEVRNIITIKDIPKHVQDAFIAIEDERFRTHPGVDIKRIVGALWVDFKTMSLAHGASTITQQTIKNYSLTNEKTWTRKIQEAYLALQLERHKSKDEILTAYLNTIPFARNKYGVQAAAKFYVGKDVKDLNIAEGALFAGMIRYPSKYDPFTEKNRKDPKDYIDRTTIVLNQMLKLNVISQEEYDTSIKYLKEQLPGVIAVQFNKKAETPSGMKYQWFIEPAMNQVALDLAEKYSITESEAKQRLRTQGYNIYLTLDQKMQQTLEDSINNYKGYPVIKKESAKVSIFDKNISQPQAAGVIMDVTNGYVKAIVGGKGPHPAMSANRAVDIQRQPGSTIKPLAVYSPAIEGGKAGPGTAVNDSPLEPEEWKAFGWTTRPENVDEKYEGMITLRRAVAFSRNIPAIRVWETVGTNESRDYLINKFHFGNQVTPGSNGDHGPAALALGGMAHGVTPLRLAAAYNVFANNGMYSEPILYTKVTDNKGTAIMETKVEQSKSLSPQTAYIMTDLLKSVISSGSGTAAKLGNMPAAGKTGTTQDNTNAWFAGYTPYYSAVVWIGNDDPNFSFSPKKGTSNIWLNSTVATPLWKDIMAEIHKGLPVKDFANPGGITTASVCLDSGKAPTDLCSKDPRGNRVITEKFIKGTEPVELCDVHVEAEIDVKTGKLKSEYCPPADVQRKVFLRYADAKLVPSGSLPYVLPSENCDLHKTPSVVQPTDPDEDEDDLPVDTKPGNGKPDKPITPPTKPTSP